MTEVDDLLRLQGIDSEIAASIAKIGILESILARNEAVEAAKAAFGQASEELGRLEQRQRELDASIEDVSAKISPDEVRLYDGSVTNPKELGALQLEVQHLKERRGTLEDEFLELLGQIDVASAEFERSKTAFDGVTADWKIEASGLENEKDTLSTRVQVLEVSRADTRDQTAVGALARYDALLERKGGIAVVMVRGGTCQGCRVQLPDAVRRRAATSAEPMQCPNCDRIISVAG